MGPAAARRRGPHVPLVSGGRIAFFAMLVACAAFAGCAGKTHAKSQTTTAAASSGVTGPGTVVPGKSVRFTATGFRPGSLEVVLAPADKAACCAVRIRPAFIVSGNGTAAISFVMPPTYKSCTAAGVCKKVAWRQGEQVVVTASGYLEQAKMTTRIARNV